MPSSPIPDALTMAVELVRLDTTNPPGNEGPAVEYLGGILAEAGYSLERYELAPGRPSLVARLEGQDDLPMVYTGHLDTVPLGGGAWNRDPFGAQVEDGRLWGRGSSDMKGGVAAMVEAACRLAAEGAPRRGLTLALTAGEETGCAGAEQLADLGVLGKAVGVLVAEPTDGRPCLGHKGALWLKAVTKGRAAHGSMPQHGENAIYKAAAAVRRLERFAAEEMGAWEEHPQLGRCTLNVGTFLGGVNINSVPDQARFTVDLRTLPGQRHEGLTRSLAEALGPEVELSHIVSTEATWADPADPWVALVLGVMARHLGQAPPPAGVPYFTDGPALSRGTGGAPVVILGPGEAAQAHQTDESAPVEALARAADYYTEIARLWCLGA